MTVLRNSVLENLFLLLDHGHSYLIIILSHSALSTSGNITQDGRLSPSRASIISRSSPFAAACAIALLAS